MATGMSLVRKAVSLNSGVGFWSSKATHLAARKREVFLAPR